MKQLKSFNYYIKDVLERQNKNGLKVFSCFSCIGGSCIGYKLCGFEIIGINEIYKKFTDIYQSAFNDTKYIYNCDIRELLEKAKNKELPEELYNIDIFDASPPCTPFSPCGKQEKFWGKKKKFIEGQKEQTLDDLFFITIDLMSILKPKIAIFENVCGILQKKCNYYYSNIIEKLNNIGYNVVVKTIYCSDCGICQKRPRVFFIATPKEKPMLDLLVKKTEPILFKDIKDNNIDNTCKILQPKIRTLLQKVLPDDKTLQSACKRLYNKESFFTYKIVKDNNIVPTFTGDIYHMLYYDNNINDWRFLNRQELLKISAFPLDYPLNTNTQISNLKYVVPPFVYYQFGKQINNYIKNNFTKYFF